MKRCSTSSHSHPQPDKSCLSLPLLLPDNWRTASRSDPFPSRFRTFTALTKSTRLSVPWSSTLCQAVTHRVQARHNPESQLPAPTAWAPPGDPRHRPQRPARPLPVRALIDRPPACCVLRALLLTPLSSRAIQRLTVASRTSCSLNPRTRRSAPMYRCWCNPTRSALLRPDVRPGGLIRSDVIAPHWL